ncbi:MAG: HAD family hydrolase [Alphaproteobacteria bacterium]
MATSNTIAVFDFDHTLVHHDSFWAFMALVAGWPKTIMAFIQSLATLAQKYIQNPNDPNVRDYRTFLKDQLLKRLLAGRAIKDLAPAIEQLHGWQRWNDGVRKNLLDHHAQGHHIVVASGGLDLYLHELLKDTPINALICTAVGVKDGFVTGEMVSGNCVRLRKAEMVASYMQQHGPFLNSWGYGNLPHDLPMLALVRHRIII